MKFRIPLSKFHKYELEKELEGPVELDETELKNYVARKRKHKTGRLENYTSYKSTFE